MEQYISKSDLVAEIEKKIKQYEIAFDNPSFASYEASLIAKGKYRKLLDILQFINTIEVKEVDLEKAIDDYIYTHDGRKRLALELDWKYCSLTLKDGNEIIKFAKHFFELGIQIGNKAQKGE